MKSKIYLRVFAGLGNQQFQYAYAKALSLQLGRELVLDGSYFNKLYYPLRKYGFYYPFKLTDFNIREKTTHGALHHGLGIITLSGRGRDFYRHLREKCFSSSTLPVFINDHINNFESIPDSIPIVLDGYFQKSGLFHGIRNELLSNFTLTKQLDEEKVAEWSTSINGDTVSIHIRRGDYVSGNLVNSRYAAITSAYFKLALKYIEAKTKIGKIVVFSDDIQWVKENVKFDFETRYIDRFYNLSDSEEQAVMSRCDHNIISNSTFAWWGAYLNTNPSKIVCAPKLWFSVQANTENIFYPNDWICIDNTL